MILNLNDSLKLYWNTQFVAKSYIFKIKYNDGKIKYNVKVIESNHGYIHDMKGFSILVHLTIYLFPKTDIATWIH